MYDCYSAKRITNADKDREIEGLELRLAKGIVSLALEGNQEGQEHIEEVITD